MLPLGRLRESDWDIVWCVIATPVVLLVAGIARRIRRACRPLVPQEGTEPRERSGFSFPNSQAFRDDNRLKDLSRR